MNYSKLLSLILLLTIFGTIWSSTFLALEADNSTNDRLSVQTIDQVLPNNNDNIKSHSISNRKTTLDAEETIEYVDFFPKQTIQQTTGDTKLFWVPDLRDNPYTYYQVNATLGIIGPHCLIYHNVSISLPTLSDMNDSFENVIYPKLTEFYGTPPDVNSDEKIILLIFDIVDGLGGINYVSGFFYAMNQFDNDTYEYSNEAEILFIDGNEGLTLLNSGDFETVAHELQHLIHYGNDPNEHLWLDEGASMFAEYLIGKDPFSITTYKNPLQANPDVSLTYWDYIDVDNLVLANYGASYAFFMYLAEHYGGSSFIQDVVTRSTDGIDSVEQSLASFGYNPDFKELFRNWTIANYLDDTTFENGFYGYDNVTISMSTEQSYSNSAIPRTENSVPYWGTDYLFFDLPSDTPFNLEFKGDDQAGYIVTVILSNTSSTPLVMPVDISTIGYGNFSTEELGLTADEVTLVISSYTKGSTPSYNDTNTAPAQSYWFMMNPSGVTISLGNLIFSGVENPLSIFNITVKDSDSHIWQEADGSTYDILNSSDMSTGISGNLTYNLDKHYWESPEINITSLTDGDYRIEFHFFNDTSYGIGYSEAFTILTNTNSSTTTIGLSGMQIPGFLLILALLSLSKLFRKRNKN